MTHAQEVMKLSLKLMLKVTHTGNAFNSPDGDTTDVLTACCNLSLLHCRLITSYEATDNTVWSCRRISDIMVCSTDMAGERREKKMFKKTFTQGRMRRRKKKRRAAVTVRPLPVVTSRGCEGFKRRQLLLLLLHPLSGRPDDICEAAGQSSLKSRDKERRLR